MPSLETLISQFALHKLILTHPGSRYRTLLLSALGENSMYELFYYDPGAEDVSLTHFLTGLTYSLARQATAFGVETREVLASGTTDPGVLAEVFVRDLARLSADDFLLILDDLDRVDGIAEIRALLENLFDLLPPQCHLLLSSRTLPRLPWEGWVASRQAVILRDTLALPAGFYSESPQETPTLEAYALGPGCIFLNGRLIEDWLGHLPQVMLYFVLDRPKCTRADICHGLWPELSVEQAVNVFHVTKRRLHRAIGFDILVHDGLHYQAAPHLRLHYDVVEFVSSLVEARSASGDTAEGHWQHTIALYRGHYLQGYTEDWAVARRADFHEGYIEALQELARIREGQGLDEAALGLLLRAVSEAYLREDLHREVIRLYSRLGQVDQAKAHYEQLVRDFKAWYGIEPSPETRAVYHDIVG